MSGHFTRKIYDDCAMRQRIDQSTSPLELRMDVTKYVHQNNICRPSKEYLPGSALLVDIESSLMGLDKISSNCDIDKHPFCGPKGCLLASDPRIQPHITPYACERGRQGENAVVTTNMQIPSNVGYEMPQSSACGNQRNGFYSNNSIPNNESQIVPSNNQNNQNTQPKQEQGFLEQLKNKIFN